MKASLQTVPTAVAVLTFALAVAPLAAETRPGVETPAPATGTDLVEPDTLLHPHPSPYAGTYIFAAVDLRGAERTAGIGIIRVRRDGRFAGHVRNHESGRIVRVAGKVLRGGKLEFVHGANRVRHNLRILMRDNGCVHGIGGRYVITRPAPADTGSDERTDAVDGDEVSPDYPALTDVVRTAGIVVGLQR